MQNPFDSVEVIAFELSNRCIYSNKHERCPVNPNSELVLLPSSEIYNVFQCMEDYKYDKIVQFSIYNEPMHDPRLFLLINDLLGYCPEVYVDILTNGWYLNQELLDEMNNLGICSVRVTTYSSEEYDRLSKLNGEGMFYGCSMGNLDDRIYAYDRDYVNSNLPCIMPEKYVFINNACSVGLCCMDFKHSHVLGSLLEGSLEDILLSGKRKQLIKELGVGNRTLDLCKRCYFQCGAPEISLFHSIRG